MFGIGANELIIILLFAFLIFGPDKLPGAAKTLGQFIAKFRTAQNEMNKVIREEVYDPSAPDPFKKPLDTMQRLENEASKEDRGESFTARKARYDQQRAAQKAAEAGTAANAAENVAASDEAQSAATPKPKISADELYGVRAVKKTRAAEPKEDTQEGGE